MRRTGFWLKTFALVLSLLWQGDTIAQARAPLLDQIDGVIETLRHTPPASREQDRLHDTLLGLIDKLAPGDADEKLVGALISLLDESTHRDLVALCLFRFSRQPVAHKAVPRLLEVLPEEDCIGPAVRTGVWASYTIRYLLKDMGVGGRDWPSEKVSCPPRTTDR